ncbi:ribosomal protein L1/ribosomal biogenesis protein [Phycomyces blakesleeanus]|uniref:Ribosomal protein L1 n=2 Tax=Phycomyces blakesleeanus TaxID=4837 RepID=A0A167ME98_PHYB8|nr:hypothetical protein PHYBLDRAFT_146785 [Phycomyces blakesleeanus NRRL 1555(-)]OAD72599.1 hypothetical protein PHYBLDRAFT_146785 [Phycomyces blakesleeanus NRRL 1555(-)]|eukprot:XP_018290639.1 hypothetical protein PHYBLDRAFT_146785 [Phycomyces blakesleeanus NRRL 1555(-)]
MAKEFDEQQAKKAIQALYKTFKAKASEDLLDSEPAVHVQLVIKKVSGKPKSGAKRLPMKYSPLPENADVCLIVKDNVEKWEDLIKTNEIANVSKVIDVKGLETTYKTYEARRKLAGSYDAFLVSDNVTHLMPARLGSTFVKRNKFPNPVRLTPTTIKQQIEKVLRSSFVRDGGSTTTSAKIGHLGLTEDQLHENLVMAVPEHVKAVAGNWDNVLSISLLFPNVPALVFYSASFK